jgi:hypothetical protein
MIHSNGPVFQGRQFTPGADAQATTYRETAQTSAANRS